LITACRRSDSEDEKVAAVVPVTVITVTPTTLTARIEADAVLYPLAQAAIVPKITAPVHRFYVQRGDRVKTGQLLATLENRDLAAAVNENRGAYEQAQAAYQTTTRAAVPEEVQKAQLDAQAAKANLDAQRTLFDSRTKLFQQGAISGKEVDAARVALVQAQAQYDVANKHLESLQSVSKEAELKGAEAQLQSARGKFAGAEAQLSYSEIRSPINGYVTDRPLYAGETAQQGTPLITVMETRELVARVHLPQAAAASLKVGDPADVSVPGQAAEAVEGHVSLISPALDPGSTTVEVWIKIPNPEGTLRPGSAAHVAITARTLKNALAVPADAIVTKSDEQENKKVVFTVSNDNVAHATEVETGLQQGNQVQVTKGLSAGTKIVSAGAYGLDDGMKVQPNAAAEQGKDSAGEKD
jgi:multidrug efflux pump subunit AcrA (membrane-fusion protein)